MRIHTVSHLCRSVIRQAHPRPAHCVAPQKRAYATLDVMATVASAGILGIPLGMVTIATCKNLQSSLQKHSVLPTPCPPLPLAGDIATTLTETTLAPRLRHLLSDPTTVAHLNHFFGLISHQKGPISAEKWFGAHHCVTSSQHLAPCLQHLGFDVEIVTKESLRMLGIGNVGIGIDHAWLRIPSLHGRLLQDPIIIDLTCRQYTGHPQNHPIEVPHGAVAPQSQFLSWVGPKAVYWEDGKPSDISQKVLFAHFYEGKAVTTELSPSMSFRESVDIVHTLRALSVHMAGLMQEHK